MKERIEMTLSDFYHLISMLPNPINAFHNKKHICTILFTIKKDNIKRIRMMDFDDDSTLSKENVFYDNCVEIQFKLNFHTSQIPLWEPVEPIHIKKYDMEKEIELKEKGLYKYPF